MPSSGPVWSPDGLKLAFGKTGSAPPSGSVGSATREIFVVNADGSRTAEPHGQPRRRQSLPGRPTGRHIAFSSTRDTSSIPNLYVMNADGSGQRQVTRTQSMSWGSSWSPDGRRLAFASGVQGNPGNFKIYVVNVDGSGQHQLTRDPGPDNDPAWSPTGGRSLSGAIATSGRSEDASGKS